MKILKLYLIHAFIMIIAIGCKADPGKTVEALVKSYVEPVSIESSLNPEIGEIITTDDSTDVTIKISNNSADQIKNITYDFDTSENLLDYKPNIDGLAVYPGAGGTCGTSLSPKNSCTIKMSLTPRKQGEFTITGKISYLNRVEPQSKDLNYHLISGQPASL
ncbi:MAG: hypothetical protein K2Q18_12340, partial [Bdellovibrionales bacterium]|nr:hypothetical protein [Bdellovibrionales bacterium]